MKRELDKVAGQMTDETKRVKEYVYRQMHAPKKKKSKLPKFLPLLAVICISIVAVAVLKLDRTHNASTAQEELLQQAEQIISPLYFEYHVKEMQYTAQSFMRKEELQETALQTVIMIYSLKRYMNEQQMELPEAEVVAMKEQLEKTYTELPAHIQQKMTFNDEQREDILLHMAEHQVALQQLMSGHVTLPPVEGDYIPAKLVNLYNEELAPYLAAFKKAHFDKQETLAYTRYEGEADVLFPYKEVEELALYTNARGELAFFNTIDVYTYLKETYPFLDSLVEKNNEESEMSHLSFSSATYVETKAALQQQSTIEGALGERAKEVLSIFEVLENSFADKAFTFE